MAVSHLLAGTDPRVPAALRKIVGHPLVGWTYSRQQVAYAVQYRADSNPMNVMSVWVSREAVWRVIDNLPSIPLPSGPNPGGDAQAGEEVNTSPETDAEFESDDIEPVGDSENDSEPGDEQSEGEPPPTEASPSDGQSPRAMDANRDELERRWNEYARKRYGWGNAPSFASAWEYATARRDEAVASRVWGSLCTDCGAMGGTNGTGPHYKSELLIDYGDRSRCKPVCEFHAVEELLNTEVGKLDRYKDDAPKSRRKTSHDLCNLR